jgi:riboflavin kinase/FMN adenylyltransferase
LTPRHASLEELHLPASVLTIGSFDGVHRGHQALIGAMVEDARRLSHPAIVLTFFPHPSVVLRGRRPSFYIMTPEEKAAALAALGVDVVVTQRFDQAMAHIPASEFLSLLQRHLGFRPVGGRDFAIGHAKATGCFWRKPAANTATNCTWSRRS